MPIEVTVPDIGDFKDVPVIEVLVKPGQVIALDDPILVLESDKASMEVPSAAAGKVAEVKVKLGDKVSAGTLVLTLEGEGAAAAPAPAASAAPAPAAAAAPAAASAAKSGDGDVEYATKPGQNPDQIFPVAGHVDFANVHASPSVRRLARELEIDLTKVKGTGDKGRVTKDDVRAFLAGPAAAPAGAAAPAAGGMGIPPIPVVDFSKFGPVENIEMPRIKKISGPALHRSWLNVPHVTHNEEADITEIDQYRKELDTAAKADKDPYRVTLLSFVIKASVAALKQHWEVNSSIHPDGDKLIRKGYYNIGFAADTPNGLVVPVIKDADRKGLVEISRELGTLSKKARDGKLGAADMSGATFTISSLGGIGGTSFTPIVNAPEVAILGLTRSKMAPVWNGETFVPRNMLPMSLSYDHRAIDGALAARFCATLAHLMGDVRRLVL